MIRKAVMDDFPAIEAVYEYARDFMAATGNPNQWGKTNPTADKLKAHIENGDLYLIIRQGEIAGVFAFIFGEDPTYGYIDGAWHSQTPYAAIHCVASSGKSGGVFGELMEYCAARCAHLRIDTYHDNHIMQKVIRRHGFLHCGTIYLANGSPRMAFDRVAECA